MAAFDAADEAQRRAVQQQRLHRVLAAAAALPFYQGRLTGPPNELTSYPVLAKDDLRANAAGLVRPSMRWMAVHAQTGGTTGLPLAVERSPQSIVREQATIDHTVALGGVDMTTARVAVLRGDSIKDPSDRKPPFWVKRSSTKVVFSAHHLSAANVADYAQALRAYRPDVLMAYPSAIAHLAELVATAGETVRFPLVVTSSERLPDGLRKRVGEVFGARLVDYYGQAERVSFAWSIEDGAYWFRGDYGAVEFVEQEPGLYRAPATALINTLFPVVRYETNDLFLIDGAPDPAHLRRIALGCAPFGGIAGRTAEFLVTPDGRRVIGLNHIPRGVPGVSSIQLVQDAPDHVLVVVVPGEGFGDGSLAVMNGNIAQKIPDSVRVETVIREAPVRLPSGKAPLYLNRMQG